MLQYIAKRLVALIAIVFLISLGSFFVVHLLPGDPTVTILGPNDTAHNRAILLHQLGLNKPLWQQYFTWIGQVFHGNLGQSFVTHQSTVSILANAYPVDLELIIISQLIAFAIAIPLAVQSSRRPNHAFDRASTGTTFAFLALPPFLIAPVAVLLFAVELHIFPGPASYAPISSGFWSNLHTMLLPSIVLALGSIVVYYRLLRNEMISTLQEDFITMARSKGLSDRRVLWLHALRPSSISLLAAAGVTIAGLIAGTFIVEYLLQLPGIGYQLVNAINQDDYTVVQGIVFVVAVATVIINFIADFLFTVIDPRIGRD